MHQFWRLWTFGSRGTLHLGGLLATLTLIVHAAYSAPVDPNSGNRQPPPVFSVERGYYETELAVTITAAPGSVVRYTTDGSRPSADHGQLYSDSLVISNTTVLRALAVSADQKASVVQTHTYIYPDRIVGSQPMKARMTKLRMQPDAVRAALLSGPAVSIVAEGRINGNKAVAASVEWILPGNRQSAQSDCGVAHYGGEYTQFAKKNFRLYFKKEFGAPSFSHPLFKGHEHGLAPVEEFDQLELRGGSHDMVERGFYMANIFADDSMLEMGHLSPHGRFAHVYINGSYWGVFHLRERWNAGMHRRYLGGEKSDYESINGNDNRGGWATGEAYDGDGSTWARAIKLRGEFQSLRAWVDLPQFIDFMILWVYGGCEDEYRAVGPIRPGSGFKFYINDADGFFQSPSRPWFNEPSNRTQRGQGRGPGDGPGGLFSALIAEADPEYRTLLADRIHRACSNSGPLTPAAAAARLRIRCEELEKMYAAEAVRWGYRSPDNWAATRDDVLARWIPRRTQRVLSMFQSAGFYSTLSPPAFTPDSGSTRAGGNVTITGPAGAEVFYTLDGSDPRLPGGGVSPAAKICAASPGAAGGSSAQIALDRNTIIKARARLKHYWSALTEAFYQTESLPFAPKDVSVREWSFQTEDGRSSSALEVSNISSRAVNLRGAALGGGATFQFSSYYDTVLGPGQRLILAKDLVQFRARYGIDLPVAGRYLGKGREGERLTLTAPAGPGE